MACGMSNLDRIDLHRPNRLQWRKAIAALAVGRHQQALEAVRRARRVGAGAGSVALVECEALVGLHRHADAMAVASRALRHATPDLDLAARLRVVRGRALWQIGRTVPGRAEIRRAAVDAKAGLTRARVAETEALFSWREDCDLEAARRLLAEARSLYAEAGSAEGIARTLASDAGMFRDEGRLAEALRVQNRRIDMAAGTTRLDAWAAGHADRGDLLLLLGRWEEARADLDRACELFRHVSSPRATALATLRRARVDLALGNLGAVREVVERTESHASTDADPRTSAEHALLASDLHLAAGNAQGAEASACEALRLFRVVRDLAGSCRARVRHVHAVLALGRVGEGIREGRRCVRDAATKALGAHAWLALGRALLHGRQPGTAEAFERARRLCAARPGLAPVAALGRALARGDRHDDPEVGEALKAMEAWGDRRQLAHGLAEVRKASGTIAETREEPVPTSIETGRTCETVVALADAVEGLQAAGDWPERWGRAMRAVRPAVGWFRAAWVGAPGLLLGSGEAPVGPLGEMDVARAVARTVEGPRVVRFLDEAAWKTHPCVALHGVESAIVVPASAGTFLYVDARGCETRLGEQALGLLARLARILAAHAPAPKAAAAPHPVRFPEIIGRSTPMETLFEQMARVAGSDVAVHIFGETGTGKECVAAALHNHSSRAGRPFVTVNASSISDDLFESEMFGHVKGAFTGAVADRQGHVMEAEGGTLFLDEVTDLTLRGQAKLLRFLQNGEFRRVGEGGTRRANVRLLTAANVVMKEQVARGLFRPDLMYRCTTFTLVVPPLRERGDDVLLLARHFLRSAQGREAKPVPALPREIAQLLLRFEWPGNVRQLQSEMKRLAMFAGSESIRIEHLSPEITAGTQAPGRTLNDARSACERDLIARTLPLYGGNRSRTACALGITRQGLVSKMRQLGL